MENLVVIAGLTNRDSEIKCQIAVLEDSITTARKDLAHVEATIRLFNPAYNSNSVKAKRIAPPRFTYFAMGEITQRCRDAMRVSKEPVSAEEIAVKAMTDKGLSPENRKIRSDMISRIAQRSTGSPKRDRYNESGRDSGAMGVGGRMMANARPTWGWHNQRLTNHNGAVFASTYQNTHAGPITATINSWLYNIITIA